MPSVQTFITSPTLITNVPSIGGTATHSLSRLRISRPPLLSCARIVNALVSVCARAEMHAFLIRLLRRVMQDAQRIHVFLEILLERSVRQIERELKQFEHLV